MNSTSSFIESQQVFPHAERLSVGGTTSECYRVKLYGKLHFLKRLRVQFRSNPIYVAALQKEFDTGFKLDHPHLVRYVSKTADAVLMDYVDGEPLDEFARNHTDYFRRRDNSNRFLRQIISVVGYLHKHQIVHLDLKPENILITRIGHDVKLTDLGLCYTDTYTDTMGRTDRYAAPEQKDNSSKVDARTDIFAIGRILETLPCARFYRNIISKCTIRDCDKRFQSVHEIERVLRLIALKRFLLLVASILLSVAFIVFLVWSRHQSFSVSAGRDEQSRLTDTAVPAGVAADTEENTSLSTIEHDKAEIHSDTSDDSDSALSVTKANKPTLSSTAGEQHAVQTSLPTLSDVEIEKQIRGCITPVFQRVMAPLQDSAWNNNTQKIYSDQNSLLLQRCGPEIRTLWTKLSKHYDIDEHTFYTQYSKEITNMSNALYERMLKNGE